MIRNYIKTAVRNLFKNKVYAVISMLGLVVGIAALMLVYLFINHELSYDSGFSKPENIYRITEKADLNGQIDHFAPTTIKINGYLLDNYPEVEAATHAIISSIKTVSDSNTMINYENFFFADSSFFDVLDFELLYGDPETALRDPGKLVISEKMYHTFFVKNEDPVGKLLKVDGKDYTVSAVVKEPSLPTHFNFDALISQGSMPKQRLKALERDWLHICCHSYIRTSTQIDITDFNRKLSKWAEEEIDPWIKQHEVHGEARFYLQNISDIHFDLDKMYDHASNSNKKYIYIFGFVATFLLLIAAINYINLATVRSMSRSREVGVRKVSGAGRFQLFRQFMMEALMVTLLAALLALILAELALPVFNNITDLNLSLPSVISSSQGWRFVLMLLLVWLFTAFISGIYPAVILSGYDPVQALKSGLSGKGVSTKGFSAATLRKVLVSLQLVISTGMIFATLVVLAQLKYMENKELGFESENLLIVNETRTASTAGNWDVLRQRLLQLPEVKEVAVASSFPGFRHGRLLFYLDDNGDRMQKTMALNMVDENYLDLMGVKVTRGRFFSDEYASDQSESVVINEAAVNFLGLEKPVGTKIMCGMGVDGEIIGVIADFNFESLHKKVEPLAFLFLPQYTYRVGIRLNVSTTETLTKVSDIWNELNPNTPFIHTYLEEQLNKQYGKERKMLLIFMYFSGLILLIACLGLFTVAAYTAEQKTKENGIRKILGASVQHIALLQVKEILMLAVISGFIATPLAYYLMSKWLEDFAYAVNISWVYFVISILAAVLVSIVTVVYIVRRSALASPLNAIKYE